MAQIRQMPLLSQITRHDCVAGWSAIVQWTGVPLKLLLSAARMKDNARYVIFHCADFMVSITYYESVDMIDDLHPHQILAFPLTDKTLTVSHCAPPPLSLYR